MGTGKSGRYLNTRGSGRSASDFAVVHANEGKYTRDARNGTIRLAVGGHGQDGMNLLKKYGISYEITKTYPNGVRIGNVPNHKEKIKRSGSHQSWFPKSWTPKEIKRAGEHVASLKANRHKPSGTTLEGTWKGVKVGVILTNGKIATIFPFSKQNTKRRH